MRWLDGITDSMDMSLNKPWGVGDGQGGLACWDSWGLKELDTTERLSLTHSLVAYSGFPDSSVGTESTCNAGDQSLIPGLGRSPGEGKGYPLQHSGLENSMNSIVHGTLKSWTQLSNFHFQLVND